MSFFLHELVPLLTDTIENVILYFRNKQWLLREIDCDYCNKAMKEIKARRNQDGYAWKCMNKDCSYFKTTISIRRNSFFEQFRLSLKDCFFLVYSWFDDTPVNKAAIKINCSRVSSIKSYQALRNLVVRKFVLNDMRLGGQGIVVQIDESMFRHKPKNHRGRATNEEIWVFRLVDTSHRPCKGFMCTVPDRTQNTLLEIINRICLPGTTIWSYQWAAYKNINIRLGFATQTVNHSLNFSAPETGVNTQSIKTYWNKQKNRIKQMRGIKKEYIDDYIKDGCLKIT